MFSVTGCGRGMLARSAAPLQHLCSTRPRPAGCTAGRTMCSSAGLSCYWRHPGQWPHCSTRRRKPIQFFFNSSIENSILIHNNQSRYLDNLDSRVSLDVFENAYLWKIKKKYLLGCILYNSICLNLSKLCFKNEIIE